MAFINSQLQQQTFTNTYFNKKLALDEANVAELANTLIYKDVLTSLITNINSWIISLIFYPIKLKTYSTVSQKIQIGPTLTEVRGYNLLSEVSGRLFLGEYYCEPKFKNFADYNGYSKIFVYLPYMGIVELPSNDFMGKYLEVLASIDFNTGQMTYYLCTSDIKINNTENFLRSDLLALYDNCRIVSTFNCQVGVPIPLGSSNANDVIRNLTMGTAKLIASTLPIIASNSKGTNDVANEMASLSQANNFSGVITTAFEALTNMQVSAQSDRVNSSNGLYMGSMNVQIIRVYPKLITKNAEYNKLFGEPYYNTALLGDMNGYTEISEAHIEGERFQYSTNQERDEILDLLQQGVIL